MLIRFICIAWGLWHKRNKFIYEQTTLQNRVVVNHALSLQVEYKQLQVFYASHCDKIKSVCWKPPPTDFLKLNVDGASFFHYQSACSKVGKWESFFCRIYWGNSFIKESSILVNVLNNFSKFLTDSELLPQDIRRIMGLSQEVQALHVHGPWNMATHQLTRHAWGVNNIEMWWDLCACFCNSRYLAW